MTLEELLIQVSRAADHDERTQIVRRYLDPLDVQTRSSDGYKLTAQVSSWQPHEHLNKVLAPLHTVLLLNSSASTSSAALMLRRLTEHAKQLHDKNTIAIFIQALASIVRFYEETDMPCEWHYLKEFMIKSIFIPFELVVRIGLLLFPGKEFNQYISGSDLIRAMFRDGCFAEEDMPTILRSFDNFVRQTPLDLMAVLLRESYFPPSESSEEFAKAALRFLSMIFHKKQPSMLLLFNHIDDHSYLARVCDLPCRFDNPDHVHALMRELGTPLLEIETESFEFGSQDFYERAASARSRGRAWVTSRTLTGNVVQFRLPGGHR